MQEALKKTERLRQACGGILAVYWVAMFIATHLPPSQVSIPGGSDKSIHALAFFGLGFLLSLWKWFKRPQSIATSIRTWLMILGYACVDELLQGPVGRTPDIHDGFADMIGATAGIAVAYFAGFRCERLLNRPANSPAAEEADS